MPNETPAIGSPSEFDVQRIKEEMNRKDEDELTKEQRERLRMVLDTRRQE